tara:strand:+ start:521 stop:1093 length:573 start_codon:yes stop_codon:yes gene_type:complete
MLVWLGFVMVKPALADGYNGSYYGPRIEFGKTKGILSSDQVDLGNHFGISARMATILQIVDVDCGVHIHRSSVDDKDLDEYRFQLGLRFHPLLLTHFENDRLGYTIASLHVFLGMGIAWFVPETYEETLDLRFVTGIGMEIPISNPEHSYGLWLSLGWGLVVGDVELGARERDVTHQVGLIALEFRIHHL